MGEEAITTFLGVEPQSEHFIDPSRYASWSYESERLKYEFMIDRKASTISISGDFSYAFSATSLYELCILYDRVQLETEQQFYGDRPILVFRKNYEDINDFKCLMVMKWDNGELSVWPNIYDAHKSVLAAWNDAN